MKLRPKRARATIYALLAIALAGGIGSVIGYTAAAFTSAGVNASNYFAADALLAPTGLGATLQADSATVRLSWTATPSSWAAGTRIFRATAAGGPYSQVTQIAGLGTTTYDDVPGTGTFYYVVRAYYATNWESENSNEAGPVAAGATLDHFTFDTIGAVQNSGRSFMVTVRARTSSGAAMTSFNGTVTFSVNSGAVTPATSYTFVSGVVTQPVRIIGPYTTTQTITATGGSPSRTGTSNAFTLRDWRYYFKKTTANTGTNCSTATSQRDMAENYAGSDPEEVFLGTKDFTFQLCTPAFSAGESLASGTTRVYAWVSNSSTNGFCSITASLYKNGTTLLGSYTETVPLGWPNGYEEQWTIPTTATTFAAGDRLNLRFTYGGEGPCKDTDIYYGGTTPTHRSRVELSGAGGSAYTDTILTTPGLVSYWRLDQPHGTTAAADSTGTNTGTYVGSPSAMGWTSLLTTDANWSVSFDGFDDQVTVPDSASLSPAAQLSVEAWVKRQSSSTSEKMIAEKDWKLRIDSSAEGSDFSFAVDIGGATEPRVTSGFVPSFAATYHVVGTYDGANLRIYVNGVLKATQPRTGSVVNGTGTLKIGGSTGTWFTGPLDEIAFYNTALTATQVLDHYNAR